MYFATGPGGEGVEIVGRRRLTDSDARRLMILEMLVMRRKGFTNEEIGMKYRYHPITVSKMIGTIPEAARDRIHAIGL